MLDQRQDLLQVNDEVAFTYGFTSKVFHGIITGFTKNMVKINSECLYPQDITKHSYTLILIKRP